MSFVLATPVAVADIGSPPAPPVTPPTLPPTEAGAQSASASAGDPLVGTFKLTEGTCSANVSGTYFRMIQPGGNTAGPFVQNSDSPCADKSYTPLSPGRDGGLVTEAYQPQPDPAFDAGGGGRADRITTPQKFYGVNFATATNATDPQTDSEVTPPRITGDDAGRLSGDLRSFAASWNNQHFNQGAPKPDGSTPGVTAGPSGTIDANGSFALEWTSHIVGGPFNNFTGLWRLEGTFVASSPTPSTAGAPTGSAPLSSPSAATSAPRRAAAARSTSPQAALADTGPTLPPWPGFVALAVALALLVVARRPSRPQADARS